MFIYNFLFHVQSFFIYKCPSLVRFSSSSQVRSKYLYSNISIVDQIGGFASSHSFIVVVIVIIIMNGAGRRYSSGQ